MRARQSLAFAILSSVMVVGCGGGAAEYKPKAPIDVYTDALGVSHAFATSDPDAMYGAGYIVARDRLFQLELNRRRVKGTQAEILGAASLTDDKISRLFNFSALGQADYELCQKERPEDIVLFEAFVAGINHRIDEIRSGAVAVPYGFGPNETNILPEPWEPQETFAIGKLLALGLSNSLDRELLASVIRVVAPALGSDFPLFKPAFDSFIQAAPQNPNGMGSTAFSPPAPKPHEAPSPAAWEKALALRQWLAEHGEETRANLAWAKHLPRSFSNNWAVDKKYTDNGHPYMAGDPHQGVSSPITMSPFHASASAHGGKLDVMGFTFPGAPIIAMGQNQHLAWTSTVNFADVMDIWDALETVDNGKPVVRLGTKTYPVTTRTEVIKVKGAADVSFEVREVPGQGTFFPEELLPVPKSFIAENSLFFRWTGQAATRESLSYLDQNRATTIAEFDAAVKETQVGAVNVFFADQDTIAQRAGADVPDRGAPSRGMPWRIVSGDDPENFWTRGNLADWQMPHEQNPQKGFMVSANNDPFGFTASGSVEDDPYYYGSFYASSMRSHRADQMLEGLIANAGTTKIDRKAMEDMQEDQRSDFADALVPALMDAVSKIGTDPTLDAYKGKPELVDAVQKLAAWDHVMRGSATEPMMFIAIQAYAVDRGFKQLVTPTLYNVVLDAAPPFFAVFLHNLVTGRLPQPQIIAPNGIPALLVAAVDDAVTWSKGRFGSAWPDGHTWSEINTVAWDNPFGGQFNAKDHIGGGPDTLRVSESPFFEMGMPAEELRTRVQPIFQMVFGFEDSGRPVQTLTIARGVREQPSDPHFADTDADWLAGNHKKAAFTLDEVMAESSEHVVLK